MRRNHLETVGKQGPGGRGGLILRAVVFGWSGSGLNRSREHRVVFLSKKINTLTVP